MTERAPVGATAWAEWVRRALNPAVGPSEPDLLVAASLRHLAMLVTDAFEPDFTQSLQSPWPTTP